MKAHRFPESCRKGRSAFTLVEVVAALTILALVTGSVYSLLRQSVQGAADLLDAEREDQAMRRFLELCRATLETLPPEGTLSLKSADETGTTAELTIAGAPEAFRVGPEPVSASDLVLSLRLPSPASPSRNSDATGIPVFEAAISREDFAPEVEEGEFQVRAGSDDNFFQPDEEGRYWMPLLRGIRSLEWRYWKEEERLWEEDWSEAPDRPTLVELQLWPETRPAPLRAVFAIPATAIASAPSASGSSSGPPADASSTSPSPRGDGPPVPGARRGGEQPGPSGPDQAGNRGQGRDRGPEGNRPRRPRDNRGPTGLRSGSGSPQNRRSGQPNSSGATGAPSAPPGMPGPVSSPSP